MFQEENKSLRGQNEDLHKKLEKSEAVLSRVCEELARYRAACGKKPSVDIDEEERLRRNLVVCTSFFFFLGKRCVFFYILRNFYVGRHFHLCSQ